MVLIWDEIKCELMEQGFLAASPPQVAAGSSGLLRVRSFTPTRNTPGTGLRCRRGTMEGGGHRQW